MSSFGFRFFATRAPRATAVVDAAGRRWTRGELLDLSDRLAQGFVARGLAVGDVLAIAAPNCAEYFAAYLAGLAAGLYVVPINWHLAEREIDYLLENSRAKAVVAHHRIGARRLVALSAANRLALSIGGALGYAALEEFASRYPATAPERPLGRQLPYTSATTGLPKGVLRPLAGAQRSLAGFVAWQRSVGVELESGHVHLCASMLYHAAPLDYARAALEMGHAVVLLEDGAPERMLGAIERAGVTTAFMVPSSFVRLLRLPAAVRERYSTASLRFVVHGGSPCPPEIKHAMLRWWGDVLYESYGACEAQGTLVSPSEWRANEGTVGRPIPGTKLLIVGEEGRELPPGAIGTVYLTPYTGDSFEYLGDAAKTLASLRGDYVTVGDRGYLNEAGYLFLVGRDTELIVSSGMNIYPAEIEQALLAHEAVADCAVAAVPDALRGQVPVAYVELAPGRVPSRQQSRDLLAFLGERLSAMKLPRRIEYTAALPRDPNGKLLRRHLQRVEPLPSAPANGRR
jgi:long-chain acyl-CoA synthetase